MFNSLQGLLPTAVLALSYIGVALLIFSILLDNRNPSKTLGYVLILIFLPLIGVIIYLYFGRDYRKRKLFSRKGMVDIRLLQQWKNEKEIIFEESFSNQFVDEEHKTVSKLLQTNNAFLSVNNYLKVLRNGEEKFKDLITCLEEATHHIHFEYYIIEDDPLVHSIMDILKKKAQNGIEVRIIYDDVGSSKLKNKFINDLKSSGIEIYPFMKVRFPFFTSNANYRNHRKIVIIDGKTAFTGGINLSVRYLNNEDSKMYWRDTHLRLDGECVQQLQIQFLLMWRFVSNIQLAIQISYFPVLPTYTKAVVQIAFSGPDSDWASIMLAFFKAISIAKKQVLITSPYFIPNDQILTAIQSAALSGVDVKILIPGNSDAKIVQAATMSYCKALLTSGAKVYLYNKGFIHAKTIVIDNSLATIGSTNMDYRSFNINFEVNAFAYSAEIAQEMANQFKDDLKDSTELKLNRWEKRPFTKKVIESVARLLAPLL